VRVTVTSGLRLRRILGTRGGIRKTDSTVLRRRVGCKVRISEGI
jgi:hypothetical protein